MLTVYTEKHPNLAIVDLFLSIFGPILTAAVVLVLASLLGIL